MLNSGLGNGIFPMGLDGLFQCTFSVSNCPFSLCPSLMILDKVLERSSEFAILCEVKDQNLSELNFSFVVWLVLTSIGALYIGILRFVSCFTAHHRCVFCKLKARPSQQKILTHFFGILYLLW